MKTAIIGGIHYEVVFAPIDGDKDVSDIDLCTNKITVEESLPKNQQHAAILHEAIHAMNWKKSEREVEFEAQAWYAFIRNNRDFIRKIINEP